MKVDLYTSTGTKKGTLELPSSLFEAPINQGLMHLAVIRQQSNARRSTAHVKTRGEIQGSTRKLFSQKGTGRARRGPIRSPLMRGGGKAFGPRNERNYRKDMPQKERHAALRSCLSIVAREGRVIVLEGYSEEIKTKAFAELLKKLPLEVGRKITFILPTKSGATNAKQLVALECSSRNVPGVKTLSAPYLNPVDVLGSRHLIFLVDALKVAEDLFGGVEKKNEKVAASDSKHSSTNSQSSPSS